MCIMDDTVYLELAFERAALDIRRVVHAIAGRYKTRGLPLTWRLLHEIENEALADLGLAARHDAKLLDLFLRLAGSGYPDGDEPVHISSPRQIPLITWFALDVYGVGNDARSRLGADAQARVRAAALAGAIAGAGAGAIAGAIAGAGPGSSFNAADMSLAGAVTSSSFG
jgi:hypothetical protein